MKKLRNEIPTTKIRNKNGVITTCPVGIKEMAKEYY